MQNGIAILESSMVVSYKVRHMFTIYNPVVSLLNIYPSEMESYVYCMQMSLIDLFIIPVTGNNLTALQYINTVDFSSLIRNKCG